MIHNSSAQSGQISGVDRAIASLIVAGVMFVLGYTVVRAAAAQTEAPVQGATEVNVVVPGEGTLWADFGG
jgi:hypothetical protein